MKCQYNYTLQHDHSKKLPKSTQSPLILSVNEIARAVNGRIIQLGPPGTICTDTRTLQPNQWFFAVTGDKFDGHDFITTDLINKGCVGVIGNRVCSNWDSGFVQIEGNNTVDSLMLMACYVRDNVFSSKSVVGVTGSVGKTTTKTMIALALDSGGGGVVYSSHGNWNNRIGVALSLIGAPRDAEVLVLEMGMSKKGEILELARIARPTVSVVLNVGPAHLENFESLEEIALAKSEIFRDAKPGDVCVLNGDDPLVSSLPVPHGVMKVLFGRKMGCDVRLVVAESVDAGLGVRVILEKDEETVEFVIPSPGLHLALNSCAAAAAVATLFGISLSQIGNSFSKFTPVKMRFELEVTTNGIKIINDVYNASPLSTISAINSLKSIHCNGERVAILGDMLELGPTEMESHEDVLRHCIDSDIKLVCLAGRRFYNAARCINSDKIRIVYGYDAGNLALKVVNMLNCNDVVLVKGSRGMKMEIVVDAIKAMK
ncbi:hypothetical protein ACFE04_019086 [Oxalis oulophora]